MNIEKGADTYPADDALAPRHYSHDYVVAVCMFTNPLCWFSPSLAADSTLEKFRKTLDIHKKYRDEIFKGQIYPILDRPSGYSFTGFQSHHFDTDSGYCIVYRENTEESVTQLRLYYMEGKKILLQNLLEDEEILVKNGGQITLPKKRSYKLYRYTAK